MRTLRELDGETEIVDETTDEPDRSSQPLNAPDE